MIYFKLLLCVIIFGCGFPFYLIGFVGSVIHAAIVKGHKDVIDFGEWLRKDVS